MGFGSKRQGSRQAPHFARHGVLGSGSIGD
jgi:hypothetical protein